MNNLEQLINRIYPLPEESVHQFQSLFGSPRTLNKKEYLIRQGEKVDELHFISNGVLRAYYIKDAEEITYNFYFGPTLFADFVSIQEKTESNINVVVLQECVVYSAKLSEIELLSEKNHDLTKFFLKFFQLLYIFNHKRQLSMLISPPEDRYLELLNSRPKVFQQMPLKFIATYLGVKPETLSRLRSQIYKPKD